MAHVVADGLEVCTDCALIIANGEISDGTDRGDQIAAAQVQIWGELAIGLVLDGADEPWFSTRPCDGCGDHLAGDRFPAAVIQ